MSDLSNIRLLTMHLMQVEHSVKIGFPLEPTHKFNLDFFKNPKLKLKFVLFRQNLYECSVPLKIVSSLIFLFIKINCLNIFDVNV